MASEVGITWDDMLRDAERRLRAGERVELTGGAGAYEACKALRARMYPEGFLFREVLDAEFVIMEVRKRG